jgi:hypothetical protein
MSWGCIVIPETGEGKGNVKGMFWGVLGVLIFRWVGVLILHGGRGSVKRGIGSF